MARKNSKPTAFRAARLILTIGLFLHFIVLARSLNQVENVQITRKNDDTVVNSDVNMKGIKDSLSLKLQSYFPTCFGVASLFYPQVFDTISTGTRYRGTAEINGKHWFFIYKSDVFQLFDSNHKSNLFFVPRKPSEKEAFAGSNYFKEIKNCHDCSDPRLNLAINCFPDYIVRADYYFSMNKYPWAKTFYERAIKIDSNCASAHLGLAKVFKAMNNLQLYQIELNKAKILDPNDSEIIYENSLEKIKEP